MWTGSRGDRGRRGIRSSCKRRREEMGGMQQRNNGLVMKRQLGWDERQKIQKRRVVGRNDRWDEA